MGGGAWPFLVGGVICLVNSVNERDRCLLNSWTRNPTTSFLTATTLTHAIGAGITAAAGTRLALQLILDKGFKLCECFDTDCSFLEGHGLSKSRKIAAMTGL